MNKSLITIFLACTLFISDALAHKCEQSDQNLWREGREFKRTMAIVGSLFKCLDRSDPNNYSLQDRAQCYWFTGRAIDSLYGLDSFRDENGYLSASAMAQQLHANQISGWKPLGPASDQETLKLGAKLSKKKTPVIAAWLGNNGQGHVSLILPGGLAYSSSWGLKVPNSANISMGAINNSFYGCRLSFALSKDKISDTVLFTLDQ